jgi:tetratricopeptide (TPR) repeat protein
VVYRLALLERTRDRVPLEWAMTQNNLGVALATLGERQRNVAPLEEAIAAFQQALLEQERVPLEWAMTQNNLGETLTSLGERQNDTGRLEEAIAAYRQALLERTQERCRSNGR